MLNFLCDLANKGNQFRCYLHLLLSTYFCGMQKKRYFLELSYNGTNYHGWQMQQNAHSIQKEVENALSVIFQDRISVTGAGRTDTGVHAEQFFAHADLDEI